MENGMESKFNQLLKRRAWGMRPRWLDFLDDIIPGYRERRMERELQRMDQEGWPRIVEDAGEVEPGVNLFVAAPSEDNPLPGYPKPSIKSGVRPLPEPEVENPLPPSGVANLSPLVKLAGGLAKAKEDNDKGVTKE